MGFRRRSTLIVPMLATLAVAAAPVAQGAPEAAPPPAPMSATMGKVQCKDFSGFAEAYPMTEGMFGADPSRVPTVHFDLRTPLGSPAVPYVVTVNGEQRSSGTVGAGGHVVSDVILPNDRSARVMLNSGQRTMLDRMVMARC